MNDFWKSITRNVLVAVISALILAFPATKALDYVVGRIRPIIFPQDIQVLELNSFINLGYLNNPPDKPDDYNICRNAFEATKTIRPPELKGRKILAITWMPITNASEVKNVDNISFTAAAENQIDINVKMQKDGTMGTRFRVLVFHTPTSK